MSMNLTKDEIEYFYRLLYKYEHESHAGYKVNKVLEIVGNEVTLDDQHEYGDNITNIKQDCLQFSPYRKNKCWAILFHVRNAFAHGNIEKLICSLHL